MGIELNPTALEDIRAPLRKMTDLELRQYGQAAKSLADHFGTPNQAFKIQLDEARAEWRRRHPPNKAARITRLPDL
jgi:hypothetical protein